MTQSKARSSVVTIAGQEVECLMLPNGEFRIAVSQVWSLLQLSAIPTNATKDVKALLGGEVRYSSTEKVASDINSQAVNTITLEQFSSVLVAAAKKGNQTANEMCLRLVGASLTSIVSHAFGVKFTQEQVVQWVEARETHRLEFHPKLTAWLKLDEPNRDDYGHQVNLFKLTAGVYTEPVDEYSKSDLKKLTDAYTIYDALRRRGMGHTEALGFI